MKSERIEKFRDDYERFMEEMEFAYNRLFAIFCHHLHNRIPAGSYRTDIEDYLDLKLRFYDSYDGETFFCTDRFGKRWECIEFLAGEIENPDLFEERMKAYVEEQEKRVEQEKEAKKRAARARKLRQFNKLKKELGK